MAVFIFTKKKQIRLLFEVELIPESRFRFFGKLSIEITENDKFNQTFRQLLSIVVKLHLNLKVFNWYLHLNQFFSVCNQFSRGVFAMLGAVSPDSFDTLHSYSNTFQMPFVTPWFPEKVSDGDTSPNAFNIAG